MRRFLAISNHGNHKGINRKWTVEEITDNFDMTSLALGLSDNMIFIAENDEKSTKDWFEGAGAYDFAYDPPRQIVNPTTTAFEYDLVYYYIISEDELEDYQYNNGHYAGLYDAVMEIIEN